MGCCCACALIIVAFITLILVYVLKKIYSFLYAIPDVPEVDEHFWWGPGAAKTNDETSIVPFKIQVTNEELADLKFRLSNARRVTACLEGIQHQYGINSKLVAEVAEFWQIKYNWNERQAFLNQYPQFRTKIQGLNIHFLHVKPTETNGLKVVPLLLLHGWPGSVREFYEVIPLFIKPQPGRNFIFEVIVPSLPGYGFSDGAARPGMNSIQAAVVLKNLMVRLNFEKWYVQGGDWGFLVGTCMSILYPDNVLGFHFNTGIIQTPLECLKWLLGSLCPSFIVSSQHKVKLYPIINFISKAFDEMGYMHLQATRPDSVGVALNDSPIGLAAYIIEKFIAWTNLKFKSQEDSIGFLTKFNYTKLLDNVMIYWITNSITTSCRFYADNFGKSIKMLQIAKIPVRVPSALAQFEHELTYISETLMRDKYPNLLHVKEYETGGHFAAFEEPIMFANDVWDAVEKFEIYHKK